MKNKSLGAIFYSLIGIFFSIALLLTAVEVVAFNTNHYDKMFAKYEISSATGLESEELSGVFQDVLRYLKDDRGLLDTVIIKSGSREAAFGERAIMHMQDVKVLFTRGLLIRTVSMVILASLITFAIFRDPKWKAILSKTLFKAAIINLLLIFLLYVLMKTDFYKYFTYFHLIFFSNDLWILDPNTELLIQMLPEGLFFDTAIKIAMLFITSNVLIGIIIFITTKKINKDTKKTTLSW